MAENILKKLSSDSTKGVDQAKLRRNLTEKWSKTGLLKKLPKKQQGVMAMLLEKQLTQLIEESNTMQSGDVQGFAVVAFPSVRRVYGELIASEIVTMTAFSNPAGLIYYIDFTYGNTVGQYEEGKSIYGGDKVGKELATGNDYDELGKRESGPYSLNAGYSSPRAVVEGDALAGLVNGPWNTPANFPLVDFSSTGAGDYLLTDANVDTSRIGQNVLQNDSDLLNSIKYDGARALAFKVPITAVFDDATTGKYLNRDSFIGITNRNLVDVATGMIDNVKFPLFNAATPLLATPRRLIKFTDANKTHLHLVYVIGGVATLNTGVGANLWNSAAPFAPVVDFVSFDIPIRDNIVGTETPGAVAGADLWGLEGSSDIPEININITQDNVKIQTKKLKASWTPELSVALKEWYNIDPDVELTNILSEHIALEQNLEILGDLLNGASAANYYWSRRPGDFVDRTNGATLTSATAPPDFTGNVSEWYETLLMRVNEVSSAIHRKTLRGGATFLVTSPEVSNLLEATAAFRANVVVDTGKGEAGLLKEGTLNRKWDVFVNPYFPKNKVLIGRKKDGDLESGYIFGVYIPMKTTATILHPDNFTPRKAILTQYGKKMIMSDFYGSVTVKNING